jgi:hypothetical protein
MLPVTRETAWKFLMFYYFIKYCSRIGKNATSKIVTSKGSVVVTLETPIQRDVFLVNLENHFKISVSATL